MSNSSLALNQNHSSGSDDISGYILRRKIAPFIITPLCHIVNICFNDGRLQSQLKYSIVFSIFKNGNALDLENYQRVAVPSTL